MNPLRIDQSADAISSALRMPPIEQSKRMRILRHNVMSFDASWWAGQVVVDAMRCGGMAGFRERSEQRWSPAVA